jgi:RecB family exonuclease
MDRTIKAHFDSYRPELPPELDELKGMKLFSDTDLLKVWRSNFKGLSYEDKKLDATLHGAVDEILVNGKKLVVLDFKTRGFPLKEDTHEAYEDQMNIYTYLLEKNGFATEDYAFLLFYYPNKVQDGSVLFDTKLVKVKTDLSRAEKLFKDAVKCLQGPEPKADKDCGLCIYVGERK